MGGRRELLPWHLLIHFVPSAKEQKGAAAPSLLPQPYRGSDFTGQFAQALLQTLLKPPYKEQATLKLPSMQSLPLSLPPALLFFFFFLQLGVVCSTHRSLCKTLF